jgi:hypothetical protein
MKNTEREMPDAEPPRGGELLPGPLVGQYVEAGAYTSEFAIGDHVRFSCGIESPAGVVTGILTTPAEFLYCVCWCDSRRESSHHEMELVDAD